MREEEKVRPANDLTLVVAVNSRAALVCRTRPGFSARVVPRPSEATSPERPVATVAGEYHFPGLSVVGVTTAGTAKVELVANGATIVAPVRGRTFAAFVPGVEPAADATATSPGEAGITVRAYDVGGALVHEGPLPVIPKR